jgi:phospholipase C
VTTPDPDRAFDHVVVLMLENRSFDHMLGLLPRTGALEDLDGLTGEEFNLEDPNDASSTHYPIHRGALYEFYGSTPGQGPGHSLKATTRQLTGASTEPQPGAALPMSGFVASYRSELTAADHVPKPTPEQVGRVMEAFTPDQLPVLSTLAQTFVVCDRWFSSVPGPTMPNRLYVAAATSAGFAYNDWSHAFDFRTIFNSLQDAGRTWRVYFSDGNTALQFSKVTPTPDVMRVFEDRFVSDVQAGDLPAYTFIEPRYIDSQAIKQGTSTLDQEIANATDEHAPADVRKGEEFVAHVYEALRSSDDLWPTTLFVVLYDEHGGFFDHVPPPFGVPNPDGIDNPPPGSTVTYVPAFDFTRLGLRVPAILISPWLAPGLDHTQYEHSSIAATLKDHFGLGAFLTERDAGANTFTHVLENHGEFRDDTPVALPRAPGALERPLDANQEELVRGIISRDPDPARRQAHMARLSTGLTQREAGRIVRSVNRRHIVARAQQAGVAEQ